MSIRDLNDIFSEPGEYSMSSEPTQQLDILLVSSSMARQLEKASGEMGIPVSEIVADAVKLYLESRGVDV